MNGNVLAEIKAYLQSIKSFFIEWNVKLVSEWDKIKLIYKDSFIDFTVKERLDDDNAMSQAVGFCFDCYSDFERKWEPLNSEELWKLLNLRPWSVRSILSRIYNKLEVYGKPILQKEQEVANIQNYQQRPRRNTVCKKQSTRAVRSKKNRTQKTLWEN